MLPLQAPSDSHVPSQQPCWWCRWYGGMANSANGLCDKPNSARVIGLPRSGCAGYQREPGADDDLWEPGR
jgi:hypothetical protein